jgi:hypothetical protein
MAYIGKKIINMEPLLPLTTSDRYQQTFDNTIQELAAKGFDILQEEYPYTIRHRETGKTRRLFATDLMGHVDGIIAEFWDESGGSEVLGGIYENKLFDEVLI